MHLFREGWTGAAGQTRLPAGSCAAAAAAPAAAAAKAAEVVFMAEATVAIVKNMDSLPLSPSSRRGMLN